MVTAFTPLPRWQRQLLLVVAGGALGWFHAPYNFWWLSFLIMPVLAVAVLEAPRVRDAFVCGWLFAFGYFLFGLYWIANALFVDITLFWWVLPFAVAGLPIVLALFWGAAAALVRRTQAKGLSGVLALAAMLALFEWLRGHVLTGFPWLLPAYLWVDVAPVRMLAATVGSYGLTLWALLAAMLPAVLLLQPSRRTLARVGVVAVILVGAVVFNPAPRHVETSEGFNLRIVQPNIAQTIKRNAQMSEQAFQTLLHLTAPEGAPRVIVWPETAVPYMMADSAGVRARIAAVMPAGSVLITGGVRREGERYFNSVLMMDSSGAMLGSYDKAHLVPYGEYVPLRTYIPLQAIATGLDFTAGSGPKTIALPGLPPLGAQVCYEVLFPGQIADRANPPSWLVNVTNDAWYGDTHGPRQHFALTRLRAVEEGVPLVRAANTGISGVIDAYGNVVVSTGIAHAIYLDVYFVISRYDTIYKKYGDATCLLLCFLLLLPVMRLPIIKQTGKA